MLITFFLTLLILYIITTLVFLSVDFYYWFLERFTRYRIGRWKTEAAWNIKINKVAIDWLPIIPAVPTNSNKHLVLWDMLKGKYKSKSVQNWQTGGLLLGVNTLEEDRAKNKVQQTVNHFIMTDGTWKSKPSHVSTAKLAYAILKSSEEKNRVKPAMDEMLKLILDQIGSDQMILYSVNRKNIRYVDTLGLVCPFLAAYAKAYDQREILTVATNQINRFTQFGMFQNTWLPVHAFEMVNKLPLGVYGWGRGTGWYVLSLIDVFLEIDDEDIITKSNLQESIQEVADYLLPFQRNDGGFGIFIQNRELSYDSSATSIFAYFYAVSYQIFKDEKYADAAKNCLLKLRSMTRRDGALDYCQGDTVDFGIFSQRLDIMPFAQGMTLRAYQIFNKNLV